MGNSLPLTQKRVGRRWLTALAVVAMLALGDLNLPRPRREADPRQKPLSLQLW